MSETNSSEHQPKIINRTENIRQRVEDRHWQLFETRLKKNPVEFNKENYTNPNDYRIINRLKPIDQPQPPIEPNRRWETFCHQIAQKSNENQRVMSIFHNVWATNWNTKEIPQVPKRRMTESMVDEQTKLNGLAVNEHDRQVISTILHRTTSADRMTSNEKK